MLLGRVYKSLGRVAAAVAHKPLILHGMTPRKAAGLASLTVAYLNSQQSECMPPRQAPRGGAKRRRAASAPPQRPGRDGAQSPAPAGQVPDEPATLEGEFVPLAAGKSYESADENDGPTGDLLEGAELLGVDDNCPREEPDGQRTAGSPTRSAVVATGASAVSKALTATQQMYQRSQALWSALKCDGTETRRFPRPEFQPYKDGTAPQGFVAGPEHELGGPRPELLAKLSHDTHPAIYTAHMGYDRTMFLQFQDATNEYAAGARALAPAPRRSHRIRCD